MSDLILVKEIRQVKGGFIVEARWPYGDQMPYGAFRNRQGRSSRVRS